MKTRQEIRLMGTESRQTYLNFEVGSWFGWNVGFTLTSFNSCVSRVG